MTTRIKKVQQLLRDENVDALIIENTTDLHYLTGLQLSAGTLLISKKTGACLFVDGRYFEACRKKAPCDVILSSEKALSDYLKKRKSIHTIAFDSRSTTYQRFLALRKTLRAIDRSLTPIDQPIKLLRALKESQELAALRRAANLGSQGFDFVVSKLRTGITEIELARQLEIFWLQKGGEGLAFEPIIAFGPNSALPHYRAGTTRLKKGQPVLIDIGVTLGKYHSDMTRVVFFGKPNPKLAKIYEIVRGGQQAALDQCRPGITAQELDNVARSYIKKAGYGEKFSHGLGHGVGLEVHELPVISYANPKKTVLEPGMAITIEPGIYIPGLGGVRIEDTVLITGKGHENLTKRSKELTIV
jgi:Xaa-Pro aminopeptidase